MSRIDDAVTRILRVKCAMGLLEPNWELHTDPQIVEKFGSAQHREVARDAVRQSLVLLKNEGSILPLADTLKRIHVAGSGADDLGMQCGGWTIKWQGELGAITPGGTTILAAIQQTAKPGTEVTFAVDGRGATGADVAVVVVGEKPYAEGEGDRANLAVQPADLATIHTVKDAGVPVVVILLSGRPLILDGVLESANAAGCRLAPRNRGARSHRRPVRTAQTDRQAVVHVAEVDGSTPHQHSTGTRQAVVRVRLRLDVLNSSGRSAGIRPGTQHASCRPMKKTAVSNERVVPVPGLTLCIADDYEAMSKVAARHVLAVLRAKLAAVLCAATGATPARTYELLVAAGRRTPALFQRLRLVQLDEWGGLAADDPATCEVYLQRKLCGPLGIQDDRFVSWHSQPRDPKSEVQRVANWLTSHGPIDLSILGMGMNGHLGFNEPAAALQAGPHVARLSRASLRHSMLQDARGPVRFGLTLGMGDLLRSREILLLVSGTHKAEQLGRLFTGEVTPRFPASFLALHPAVTICCDRAAAAAIPRGVVR